MLRFADHFIGDDEVVFSTGSPWESNTAVTVKQEALSVFDAYSLVGASPDNQFHALAGKQGITIMQSMNSVLQGEVIAELTWRELNGKIQALDPDFSVLNLDSLEQELPLEEVIPFNGGQALLLVSSQGSDHLLYDITTGQVHSFNTESSYPHYATFTKDQRSVWYNACHFYNGATLAVSLEHAESGEFPAEQDYPVVNEEARVYAAAALEDGVVIGDAYGYLRLIDVEGQEVWRYYAGSTISGLAVNRDETLLAVGTYGGMLHILDLQATERSSYEITTGTVREIKQIIAWKSQNKPLWW